MLEMLFWTTASHQDVNVSEAEIETTKKEVLERLRCVPEHTEEFEQPKGSYDSSLRNVLRFNWESGSMHILGLSC